MNKLITLIVMITVVNCSELTKKAPDLAWSEKFYWLRVDKKGVIFSRNCKNRIGDRRDCKEPEVNLFQDWNKFSPSFILIPYKEVFSP